MENPQPRKNKDELQKIIAILQEHEETYKDILDNMIEGFQIIGKDWKYIYVNDAIAKQCRKIKEEFENHTIMECHPELGKSDFFTEMKKCMANRIPSVVEQELNFPDGSSRWFKMNIHPHHQGIFVISEDITEFKNLERMAKESEQIYRSSLTGPPT